MTSRHPNVALVVLDTLRRDYFDRYFDWVPGKRYTNAFTTSNWTIPAHASLFTGRYPSEVGVHSRSRTLDDWQSALPARLGDAGYRTTMFSANPNLSVRDGWTDGFDVTRGAREFDVVAERGSIDWSASVSRADLTEPRFYLDVLSALAGTVGTDDSLLASLEEGYNRMRRDFRDGGAAALPGELASAQFADSGEFLYVNLMDCHVPYFPPREYRSIDRAVETNSWEPFVDGVSNLAEIQTAYDDCARYLSNALEASFEALSNAFDYVVVTSDHGELLGEHGLVGHVYGLYPELTRVPLVVSGPDVPETVSGRPVSLLDVHATVQDIAGLDDDGRGRSLLSDSSREAFLTEYQGFPTGLRDRFVASGVSERRFDELDSSLFGYVSPRGEYVYQTHDDGLQSAGSVPDAAAYEADLDQLRAETGVHAVTRTDEGADVPDDLRDQLESLGYA